MGRSSARKKPKNRCWPAVFYDDAGRRFLSDAGRRFLIDAGLRLFRSLFRAVFRFPCTSRCLS